VKEESDELIPATSLGRMNRSLSASTEHEDRHTSLFLNNNDDYEQTPFVDSRSHFGLPVIPESSVKSLNEVPPIRLRNKISVQQTRRTIILSYREELNTDRVPLEFDEDEDVFQDFKHKLLLVLLFCATFVVNIKKNSSLLTD
jgi:hypothetical protein